MTNAYDSIYGIGGYNYQNPLNNEYLLRAMMSPNVNFRGNENNSASAAAAVDTSNTVTNNNANNGAIQTNPIPQKADEGGITLGEGILGAALIAGGAYALIKGYKSGYIEKAWNAIRGKGGSASSLSDKLSKLTAVKCPDGKIRFTIPGKTITCKEDEIQNFVNEYGIKGAISAERQAYNPVSSALESFRIAIGKKNEEVVVFIKDGEIIKINNSSGANVLKKFTEPKPEQKDEANEFMEKFQNIVKELGKDKDVDIKALKGVKDITYTNVYGDDVLKMIKEIYEKDPKLTEFTTLQRFHFNDKEIQTFKLGDGEAAFTESKFWNDGKLVDGVKVVKFSDKIGGGYIGNFEGQTLVSIKAPDGTILPEGSAGYSNILKEHQKDINQLLRDVFEKRKRIPTGAIIQAA